MSQCRDDHADFATAKLARQQLIGEMQRKAEAARARWRAIMFSRSGSKADDVTLDRYEAEEAEARAAMVRADEALFRLTLRSRPETN